jgi:hypothetical protein
MRALKLGILVSLWLALASCSGGVTETGNPSRTYITAGSDGTFGTWQVSSSGFSASLGVTAASTGVIQYTFSLSGSCGSPGEFGFRPCTISLSGCQNGSASCVSPPAVGALFYLLEMPGVALLAYSPSDQKFHSGSVLGSCGSDVSGDYVSMPTALGGVNLFGMYRSDAALQNLIGSEFALLNGSPPSLFYTTTDGSGTGATSTSSMTCSGGVRTFVVDGIPVRSTTTASGLWTFSLPAGQGGSISFRTSLAATSQDLVTRTLYGFIAADSGTVVLARLGTGGLQAGGVSLGSLTISTGQEFDLSSETIQSVKSIGSTFGFNGNPPGFSGYSYGNNLLQPTYPTPGDIPGLFISQPVPGSAQGTIYGVMRGSTGKLILYGSGFDVRSGTIKITSSTILFEQ